MLNSGKKINILTLVLSQNKTFWTKRKTIAPPCKSNDRSLTLIAFHLAIQKMIGYRLHIQLGIFSYKYLVAHRTVNLPYLTRIHHQFPSTIINHLEIQQTRKITGVHFVEHLYYMKKNLSNYHLYTHKILYFGTYSLSH